MFAAQPLWLRKPAVILVRIWYMRLLITLLLLPVVALYGQQDSIAFSAINQNVKVISLKVNYGQIYIHTRSVSNVRGARPLGVEFEYSKQQISDSIYNLCDCYPRTGLVAGYFNFDNSILGHGAMLSYFIEPTFRLNNRLSFHPRANLGIAYLTNPFDAVKNPTNRSYSLHLNPYMQLGFGASFRLNKNVSLLAGTDFRHISNGGLKEPNRGINWITASAGVLYYAGSSNELPKYKNHHNPFWRGKKPMIELGGMFVPRQGYSPYLKGTRDYLLGIFGQYTKQVGPTSGLTGGAEIYYSKINLANNAENKDASGFFAGVHAGHVFLMNRVRFSQQLGAYVHQSSNLFLPYYFRLGIDYRLQQHVLIGASMKAHSDNADFFDLKVMYRF